MQIHQMEEGVRLRREKAKEAVSLASQGRWQEAVLVNQELLRLCPGDGEALNRLGKALSELGRYSEARRAFQESLERHPSNRIAQRNLERLAHLEDEPWCAQSEKLTPQVFIEDRGKSCVTVLRVPPGNGALVRVTAGDAVCLRVDGATVWATTRDGHRLGQLEPRLAARLVRLMGGGNEYVAAVASVAPGEVAVILRESSRHPRMSGVVSFPARGGEMLGYLLPQAPIPETVEGRDEEPGPPWPHGTDPEDGDSADAHDPTRRPRPRALAEDEGFEEEE